MLTCKRSLKRKHNFILTATNAADWYKIPRATGTAVQRRRWDFMTDWTRNAIIFLPQEPMQESSSSPHSETCTNAKGGNSQIQQVATQGEFPQELQWTFSFPAIIDSSELHKTGQVNCRQDRWTVRNSPKFTKLGQHPFLFLFLIYTKFTEQAVLGLKHVENKHFWIGNILLSVTKLYFDQ